MPLLDRAIRLSIWIPCFLLVPSLYAQLPPVTNTTSTPIPGAGHDLLGGLAETVNPANGSVSIRVPVILPPSRGLTLPFSFAYDSNGVNYVGFDPTYGYGAAEWLTPSGSPYSNRWTQGGWSDSIPTASKTRLSWTTLVNGGPTSINCYAVVNFVFQDAKGNRHNLNLTNYSDPAGTGQCTINSGDWPPGFTGAIALQGGEGPVSATIGSNWDQLVAPVVVDGDGVKYGFPGFSGSGSWLASSVGDRNGNGIAINSTFPTFSYVDTAGRTVLQDSGFATSPETLTVSGLGAPYTLTWTTLAAPTFATPIVSQSGTCTSPAHTWGTNVSAVSLITLPNGQRFSYTYDPVYSLVNKMTYPSGGYVRYVWGINAQAEYTYSSIKGGSHSCDMYYGVPAVTDRYVSFDGAHEVLHQHYVYTTTWPAWSSGGIYWTSKQTTVTTYDLVRNTNFQTIYSYSPIYDNWQPNSEAGAQPEIPVESSIAYYDTTGALLKTVTKGWQNERLLTSQQTTYPNGQASKTTWSYNASELETEHDDYDFPSGGTFLRATVTSYATSTSMGASHVIDKPASVVVFSDAAKTNRVAETDYTYDNPIGTTTSGIVQHGGTCNCGNLTQESRWLNSSGTTLKTTYTNDDTGQRLSMTDPRGSQTVYSYADSYSSGSPSGPTDTYLTTVTHPQTNGVSHIEKFSYAYASGEVTSSTDQNNLVTSYKYVDNLARLTETDFPDGGMTSVAYNDAPYNPSAPSPSITTTKKINTSTSMVTVSAMDGLGHLLRNEVTSDPQGTIYTDTAYDGMARVYTVSNPYRSGADPTTSSGTTTYAYDAIGRKLIETYPDNSVLNTAYCAGSTLVTDPTGKWRRSRVDGLGRLVEVDEPNAVGAAVASTGCPGTGEPIWITSYGYDLLGNLTSVLQNGSHPRSFTYDSVSRLLCASNPENSFAVCPASATNTYTPGTTGYTYDGDGNLATKTISTSHLAATSGSGSATVSGSEQSIVGAPAVSGTGSVTVSGTLQSKQVVSQPATHATGSVSIQGTEQSGTFCDDLGQHCHFLYDSGSVTIAVNGSGYTVSYGQYDTTSTVATNLASKLNAGGVVTASTTATPSGTTVNLTSVATGTAANYSLSASSLTNDPVHFSLPSFNPFPSGSSLTGGQNTVYTTRYDSGSSTITVNGHSDTASWSGSSTTTASIASSLASAVNADSGAYVSASASGATVNLTAKTAGVSTNYSLSSSYTYDSADFSGSSFTSSNSGAALTGGRDAGATVYDSGSVWISVNNTQYSVSYGQGSSSSSLAGTLASAINAGSIANATANGSGISITAKATGAATNYSLSSGSSTSQPGSFSSPSFTVSVSGVSLTGGTDPDSPVVTTYAYDALNRMLSRSYSNGDPSVSITYDQSNCLGLSTCQNVGQRTSMTDAAGSEAWSYQVDSTNLRSIHVNRRITSNITKTSTYYLDLAGNITQAVYPTGRVVNYTYDAASRPKGAADGANGITYASDFQSAPAGCLAGAVCYTPQGTFYALSIGQSSSFSGLNLTHSYNSRLQPNEFKASSSGGNAIDITYGFVDPSTSRNAGHVYAITNNLDGTRSQTFGYDQLNRITSALTTSTHATSPAHCWGENYSLDAWGNLNSIAATTNSNYMGCFVESGFATTADGNNHLPIFSYDPSGNTGSDGSVSYSWDAESQLKSAVSGGATTNYIYDGDGRRASKSSGKLYWYGSGGDILAETDASGNNATEYVFFGGKRVAMLPAGGSPIYYVEDLLGTSRVMTTNSGVVCYDADFYPYGGEAAYTNSCAQNYKFEGKERDSETGNDDFGARYYSNRFGRWLSADWSSVPVAVPYANLTNPQTLNLYSMVADDPESFADLDGHENASQGTSTPADGGGPSCAASGQSASGASATNGCSTSQPAEQMDLSDTSRFYTDPASGVTLDMSYPKRNLEAAQGTMALASLLMPPLAPALAPAMAATSAVQGNSGDAALSLAAAAPLGGIAKAAQLGRAGEEGAQIVKNTERIASETGAAYRVPDMLNHAQKTIGEVKNSAKVYLTNQMKDIISYAGKKGYNMELVTRAGARLSKPLSEALQTIKAVVTPRL